ncbi:MAG: tRNA (adenosine(37)-N6)-threonylcarbamoyltransferase complex ATPase subunit type 1 TsaE [Rhizobiaceae bacterium]
MSAASRFPAKRPDRRPEVIEADGDSGNLTGPIFLKDEAATNQLGEDIAMVLRPGDMLCLRGDLGAGKTTLARAVIRKLANDSQLEVPSPTYTLCQTYDSTPKITHLDFYRISEPEEIHELGFEELLETGVSIIEWPERASGLLPDDAVWISLDIVEGNSRQAVISHRESERSDDVSRQNNGLLNRISRSLSIRKFLDEEWTPGARRSFLVGDASTRRYEIVDHDRQRRILMDSPRQPDGPPVREGLPYSQIAHLAEDVIPFIGVGETLLKAGLAAPVIHGRRNADGLLLIEHLGNEKIITDESAAIPSRYLEAARLVALLHKQGWTDEIQVVDEIGAITEYRISRYDEQALKVEVSLFLDWYVPEFSRSELDEKQIEAFHEIWNDLIAALENSTQTLVLRDYHSPNIIWRESEPFPRNIGLIDFQDAVIGPQAYDLASLAQDARVDISSSLEERIINVYLEMRADEPDFNVNEFQRDFAILGAQRATKILGIFVRLNKRDGKPDYLKHLPRMRDYLGRNLGHPILSDYREWCSTVLDQDLVSKDLLQ